jgi:alkanesulfonate monooxygenase SsuD/methylene tetrahydromethanopterin reductase-like flavin-dependent oxidoreductase (luciferase family)
MKFGLSLPPFGEHSDPRALAELAREAEQAGWDGFFIWDHITFDANFHPMADAWVALGAIAMTTQRIRIGTMITPLARRRPWKLARETVTVDQLSGGRMVLGVGLGEPAEWEFGAYGEETDARHRAEKLDEGLTILDGLWRGERFNFQGQHYHMEEVQYLPRPVQQPRIPIWVGGWWPNKPPMRRAARWDGVFPIKADGELSPDEWRDILAYIRQHRSSDASLDAVHGGPTPGDDPARARDKVAPYEKAGVTWWLEDTNPWRFGPKWGDPLVPGVSERIRERILQGPPRIT